MKKKILALLLSSICILGGTSVYAENTTITNSSNPQSADVSVSINKPETWEVVVPKNITLTVSGNTAASGTVTSDTQSIIVKGDLYGGRTLTLGIPDTCILKATKGTNKDTTLTAQVNTVDNTSKSFTSDVLHENRDTGSTYKFNLSAPDIKAETWTGTMTVNISVK